MAGSGSVRLLVSGGRVEWWWPIEDLKEFAAFPQVYVRIPLVGDIALEVPYVAVREKQPLAGGLDVTLMFYFPK